MALSGLLRHTDQNQPPSCWGQPRGHFPFKCHREAVKAAGGALLPSCKLVTRVLAGAWAGDLGAPNAGPHSRAASAGFTEAARGARGSGSEP